MTDGANQTERAGEALTWEEFRRVEARVGRVVTAEPLIGARHPAYRLEVDFGPEIGVKRSSAQLTALYSPEELAGRLVVGVVNFPPKRIAGFVSEVLILGLPGTHGEVVLLEPERDVPLGGRVY